MKSLNQGGARKKGLKANHIHLGLVHYPVYDKRGEVVTTAITSLDIHDIARCAKTFGLGGFFVVTPLESQIRLLERLIHHWIKGAGSIYNPIRKESLSLVRISRSIEEARLEILSLWKRDLRVISTGASPYPNNISFSDLKKLFEDQKTSFFLLFGTGWGLTREVKESSDFVLAPIEGEGYNHLSVRSAVAIILDRLLGER